MIWLEQVYVDVGGAPLLRDWTWQINAGDRVGLCGANGSGKTTLLRLLAGQIDADSGSVRRARQLVCGYLPQSGLEHQGQSLFATVREACAERLALEQRLQQAEQQLAQGDKDAEFLEHYAQLQETFRQRGGYEIDADVGRILDGLGFVQQRWQDAAETFSGGWQMRIALARLLVQRPDVLLLDEPTNHLDLPARQWLQQFLQEYPGAVLLVSHDRHFLDGVVGRILEIWQGRPYVYNGNYSAYLQQRQQVREKQRQAYEEQQAEIARIEAFVQRFRYQANKASQVQSRIKYLEKLERVEPPPARPTMHFQFPPAPHSGSPVLTLEGLTFGYGEQPLLKNFDFTLYRGEKVALLGPNGAGKSTLMSLIVGDRQPWQGRRILGHKVAPAYFAQDQGRALQPQPTVWETALQQAPVDKVPQVRDLLGAFLFTGETVNKPVQVLSGGERNRLALALMLLRPANLLLLDEPTNHLDLDSKDILLQALQKFAGSLLFVSHDQYFVEQVATRVLWLEPDNIIDYPGPFAEFQERVQPQMEGSRAAAKPDAQDSGGKEQRRQQHAERKAHSRQQQKYQRQIQQLEEQIEAWEQQQSQLEEQLAQPKIATDPHKCQELTSELQKVCASIEAAYEQWQTLQEALEEALSYAQ